MWGRGFSPSLIFTVSFKTSSFAQIFWGCGRIANILLVSTKVLLGFIGLNESPTVMVVEAKNNNKNLGKNRGILKPSRAFVETNNVGLICAKLE